MPIEFANGSQIRVGPFLAEKEGKFAKTFRLFYFDDKCDMQYFGPRFGFEVRVENSQKKKLLTSTFRTKIEAIKKGYKVMKETEYIVERLKELGINEENYEESLDVIPDIIQTL